MKSSSLLVLGWPFAGKTSLEVEQLLGDAVAHPCPLVGHRLAQVAAKLLQDGGAGVNLLSYCSSTGKLTITEFEMYGAELISIVHFLLNYTYSVWVSFKKFITSPFFVNYVHETFQNYNFAL